MSRFIVRIRDRYLDWSTVVDAPVTSGMTLGEFHAYYVAEYGPDAESHLNEFIRLADETGSSNNYDWRSYNRAGPNEVCLNEDELYQVFCLGVELDAATVQRKLREQEEKETQRRSIARPLSPSPTSDEVRAACKAIEDGWVLAEVEAILGKGKVAKTKTRRDVQVRWCFEKILVN